MNPHKISVGSKVHNSIVQAVFIAGLIIGILPDLSAAIHIPAWVGPVLGAIVKIGNEFLDDQPAKPSEP